MGGYLGKVPSGGPTLPVQMAFTTVSRTPESHLPRSPAEPHPPSLAWVDTPLPLGPARTPPLRALGQADIYTNRTLQGGRPQGTVINGDRDSLNQGRDRQGEGTVVGPPHSFFGSGVSPPIVFGLGILSRQSTPQPERALPVAAPTVMTHLLHTPPKIQTGGQGRRHRRRPTRNAATEPATHRTQGEVGRKRFAAQPSTTPIRKTQAVLLAIARSAHSCRMHTRNIDTPLPTILRLIHA